VTYITHRPGWYSTKKNQAKSRPGSCSKSNFFASGHFSHPGFNTVYFRGQSSPEMLLRVRAISVSITEIMKVRENPLSKNNRLETYFWVTCQTTVNPGRVRAQRWACYSFQVLHQANALVKYWAVRAVSAVNYVPKGLSLSSHKIEKMGVCIQDRMPSSEGIRSYINYSTSEPQSGAVLGLRTRRWSLIKLELVIEHHDIFSEQQLYSEKHRETTSRTGRKHQRS
jgi:hypothetical protein